MNNNYCIPQGMTRTEHEELMAVRSNDRPPAGAMVHSKVRSKTALSCLMAIPRPFGYRGKLFYDSVIGFESYHKEPTDRIL